MTGRTVAGQAPTGLDPFTTPAPTHTLGHAPRRGRAVVAGTVRAVTPVRWAGGPATEVTLADPTGTLTLVFFGRRGVAGVDPGRHLTAAGTVGTHLGRPVVLSPQLWLTATPALAAARAAVPAAAVPAPAFAARTPALVAY